MIQAKISPCLWFYHQAEAAAEFYTSIFPNSRILHVMRYGEEGRELHGKPPGSVLSVEFELDGQQFSALNGPPLHTFNESISFQIDCPTQKEIDHYWKRLGSGGDPSAQQSGWLKDRFGVSWQIFPAALVRKVLTDPEEERARRAFAAMLRMKKFSIATLLRAYGE